MMLKIYVGYTLISCDSTLIYSKYALNMFYVRVYSACAWNILEYIRTIFRVCHSMLRVCYSIFREQSECSRVYCEYTRVQLECTLRFPRCIQSVLECAHGIIRGHCLGMLWVYSNTLSIFKMPHSVLHTREIHSAQG